jgi:uncharacterized protein (DUF697 family)
VHFDPTFPGGPAQKIVNMVDEFSAAARIGQSRLQLLRTATKVTWTEKSMLSDTLPWNRLPARRRSAAAHSRVVEAILELLANVPSTDRHAESDPASVAREISRRAAAKAAVTAGSLAMPPGPLGWLTIAPELLAVWKIQAQMVSDLAGVYGKTATLTKEHMVYCLFRHTAAQLLRDVAVRVVQRSAGSAIARWLPAIGAVGVGTYAFYDTSQVAATAIELFEKGRVLVPAEQLQDLLPRGV